nr:transmembrane protein 42-like [Pocillopora verrucosa]
MPGRFRLLKGISSFAMLGFVSAVCAGFCAAVASTCAKLAMSPELQRKIWCNFLLQGFGVGATNGSPITSACQMVVNLARASSFLLVFLFNALMWTLFVKSLRASSSSATATVTNTASNFICTALLGCLLFGETLSMQWWLGTSLILTGLILIHYNSAPLTNDQGHDKRE